MYVGFKLISELSTTIEAERSRAGSDLSVHQTTVMRLVLPLLFISLPPFQPKQIVTVVSIYHGCRIWFKKPRVFGFKNLKLSKVQFRLLGFFNFYCVI